VEYHVESLRAAMVLARLFSTVTPSQTGRGVLISSFLSFESSIAIPSTASADRGPDPALGEVWGLFLMRVCPLGVECF